MTPSQRIRKAALGPTPWFLPELVNAWTRDKPPYKIDDAIRTFYGGRGHFYFMSDTERRMFLLFVAEALENE